MAVIKPVLHHVTLKTSHLPEMIDWYCTVTGAEVNYGDDVNAWLTNDDANHRIAFLAVPGLRDDVDKRSHNGIHHTAFEYRTFADLMSSYARLRDEGIRPAFCLEHGLTISIYYKDPEGNFVELQSDNFGDWSLSTQWMRTSPEFAANPIGIAFDAARVYQAHQSGLDFKALQQAIRRGEYLPDPAHDLGLPLPEELVSAS